MRNEAIYTSINHLITNAFLDKGINCKLYVCHYIFCAYVLTNNGKFVETALDMLKETLKIAFLNKKKNIGGFNDAVNYCVCVSILLGIELEIDELIDDNHNEQSNQIFMIHNENFLGSKSDPIRQNAYKKHLPILILLQIRKKKINHKNHMKYIKVLYDRYSINNIKEYLLCISLISYFFKKADVLKDVIDKLNQQRLKKVYKQVVDLIMNPKANEFSQINANITTIIRNTDNELNIELGVLYYILIDEKAKRCFGQFPRH